MVLIQQVDVRRAKQTKSTDNFRGIAGSSIPLRGSSRTRCLGG